MRTGEAYRFGHKVWCDIIVVEAAKEPVKVEAPVDPVKLVAQQPVSAFDLEESVYPSLDDVNEEDGDKSGSGDPANGEPIVKVVSPSPLAPEVTAGEPEPSALSTSITVKMLTPKYIYY